jgi:hypothetical protein
VADDPSHDRRESDFGVLAKTLGAVGGAILVIAVLAAVIASSL